MPTPPTDRPDHRPAVAGHGARFTRWRHADEEPKRDAAVERLVEMIHDLVRVAAKEKFRLAPFIGVGCLGVIQEDGAIERGAQNLPGNWESSRFNLPQRLAEAIPEIEPPRRTTVMPHLL